MRLGSERVAVASRSWRGIRHGRETRRGGFRRTSHPGDDIRLRYLKCPRRRLQERLEHYRRSQLPCSFAKRTSKLKQSPGCSPSPSHRRAACVLAYWSGSPRTSAHTAGSRNGRDFPCIPTRRVGTGLPATGRVTTTPARRRIQESLPSTGSPSPDRRPLLEAVRRRIEARRSSVS